MVNLEETTIKVNSEVLTDKQLEEKRQKIKKWQDFGYNTMAILYFLAQEVKVISATYEETGCTINLG